MALLDGDSESDQVDRQAGAFVIAEYIHASLKKR